MASPRFVVTRRIPDAALELLAAEGEVWLSSHDRPLTRAELHAAAEGASAIVSLLHDRVDEDLLRAAGGGLRCVANVAVGFDNVDVPAATRHGVVVTNTPAVLTEATADLAIGLMLAVTRRLGEGERLVRARTPWSWHMYFLLGAGLQHKTLGLIGLGAIGQATARRARAFGMRVVYADARAASLSVAQELGASRLSTDELLGTADVLSLHCPLTPETHHLIDAAALRRMKPTAYVVNTARGPIVDEAALVAALEDGVIAGAALDVFEHEPDVHPGLLELDNVVVVPHLGSATVETRTAMAELAARNAIAVVGGADPLTAVNAAALQRFPG